MHRPSRIPAIATLVLVAAGLLACDDGLPGSTGEPPIDRETFVETYVELRVVALRAGGELPVAERERILAEHQVTEEDLRAFIDVHGRNVPYMNALWTEIALRVDEETEAGRPSSEGANEGGGVGAPDG